MNQSLVTDSDECWCSSTGRLKETSQERKKLPNAEVVQIKWKSRIWSKERGRPEVYDWDLTSDWRDL